MSQILGVKFNDFGQIYYFSSGPFVVREGHSVIVKTEQGMGLGRVFVVQQDLPEEVNEESLKTIYRLAGDEDLEAEKENRDLSRNAHRFCKDCIDRQSLEMKLVDVEVFFDRSKMIFYFTAPGRIDFRELVKELVKEYRTRIELRQIGVRHETQMLGAIGNCGQICCCRRFMRKFMPVTIRMAKEQNLFLNPTKISGICGRLLCCLSFEQDNYEDFHKKCPKIGKRYNTVHGSVRVTRSNFFRNALTVMPEEGEEIEISLDDWPDILRQPGARVEAAEKSSRPVVREKPARQESGWRAQGREEEFLGGAADKPLRSKNESVAEEPERKEEAVPEAASEDSATGESAKPERKSGKSRQERPRPPRKRRPAKTAERPQKEERDAAVKSPAEGAREEKEQAPAKSQKAGRTRRPSKRRRRKKPSGTRKN